MMREMTVQEFAQEVKNMAMEIMPEEFEGVMAEMSQARVRYDEEDILMDGRKELHPGQRVEHDVVTCDDGRIKAANVTVIEEQKPDIGHACVAVLTPDGMKPVL